MYVFWKTDEYPPLEGAKALQIDTTSKEAVVEEWEGQPHREQYEFILSDEDGMNLVKELEDLRAKYIELKVNLLNRHIHAFNATIIKYKKVE